jgi:hypothetical protein
MSFDFVENFTVELPDFSALEADFSESFNSKQGLIIEVAAIHEGLTANYNNYSAQELEKALESWVEPYPKPIILNHDLNNEPIGRVIAAKMDKESDGSAYVRLQVAITDPVAAQKVMDKRYLTGSVGGRASKAVCSISGEDLAQETDSGRPKMPKYRRGKVYKGKLAYIDMQDISFKEYSFVNQPADQKSGVRTTKVSDGDATVAASDSWVAKSSAFVLHMDNEDIVAVEENESIFKNMKKKDSKTKYLRTKGAFLSAMAIHESESDVTNSETLLSNEDLEVEKSEEISTMNDITKDDDILAVATGLSEDLSNIASSQVSEDQDEEVEATEGDQVEVNDQDEVVESSEEAEESEDAETEESEDTESEEAVVEEASEEISADDSEKADVQEESVDSENAEKPEESSVEDTDEVQEVTEEESLTAEESGDEQSDEDHAGKVALLEEEVQSLKAENSKLKAALHMTLVERVVDTKIALGLAEGEQREAMISEHASRTASSLADSLRDMASMPVARVKKTVDQIEFDVDTAQVTEETNVTTVNVEEQDSSDPEDSFEQVLVDALMGRRKL